MADGGAKMVFLGFGKWARADRIYALQPITGDDRGGGRRTLVWVEGIGDAVVASRTVTLTLESAWTVCTSRPTRSVKRFDTSTRLTSPIAAPSQCAGKSDSAFSRTPASIALARSIAAGMLPTLINVFWM